jgi:hypothetical protein
VRYGRFGLLAAGVAALATSAGLLVAGGGAAIAAGGGGPTPPWISQETVKPIGSITFYNAQGQVVTGGSITANGLAAYAVGTAPDSRTGDFKAALFAYTPVAGQNPQTWSGEELSLATAYPNMSAPVPISGTANPVESNNGTDTQFSQYIEAFPNTQTTSGYPGLYDIRLEPTGIGQPVNPNFFYETVISVNTKTSTWSVDFPDWTQNTTTTVTASPATETTSAPITLTATVAPSADSGGTVSFWNGATQVGTTQTVSGGTASVTTTPATGTTDYTAIFTPTVGSADIGSTGSLSYLVGTGPATTTTTLTASPASPVQQGSSVTLTATEVASDSTNPAGSVQFFDGTSSLGSQAVNGSGVATLVTTKLPPTAPAGSSLTATFTPTNTSGYSGSTSMPVTYAVNPVAAKPTITGPHQAGKTESCSEGSVSSGVAVSYTWLASGKKIGTGAHLVVPGTAYKKALACEASVSDGGGPVSSATSASVTVSRGGALKATKKPSLSGAHKVGKTERVNAGKWADPGASGVSFTYQWLLNGKVIKHATKSSLKLTRGDKGKKISCRVTAHAAGFANGSATTSSVKVS